MSFFELFLTGVALSMDAFAVSVCKGLSAPRLKPANALETGLFFGGFQALMPLLGWLLGRQFESYITEIDHWIAFVLLAFIGGKMIWEVLRGGDGPDSGSFAVKELFVLAIATSIDALAMGVTFAFLSVNIWSAISVIGATTFCFSFAGVYIGAKVGGKFHEKAELAGGVVLILIGLKILLEHLGVINF